MLIRKETTRREFVAWGVKLGISISALPYIWDMISPDLSSAESGYKETKWYTRTADNKVQCEICPKNCLLEDGQTCFCRTRTNIKGKLMTSAWNNPSVVEMAKIESAPLYHYAAGTEFLAIGVSGCNLRCSYCQNHTVSQHTPEETRNYRFDYKDAVSAARGKKLKGILFTFTEPVAYLEYMTKIAEASKSNGLAVAAATSGYINEHVLKETAKNVDAFTVTLKGFGSDFYRKVCNVEISNVLNAMETIKREGKWLEVVNLIIPTLNDNPAEIMDMAVWIKNYLGNDTPLHFTRFYPAYRMKSLQETPITSLENARNIAMSAGLKFVYTTNIPGHPGGDTYCPNCGNTAISRKGFDVVRINLTGGRCIACGKEVAGRFVV